MTCLVFCSGLQNTINNHRIESLFLQHLTWILGLKPSAGGTLKAMPTSEAPNLVRIIKEEKKKEKKNTKEKNWGQEQFSF